MSLASRGAEFFRFCIVGGLTFLVDYGLLFLLTSVLDVHYLWSSAWAFIVAVIVNYYLCVFFVFHQAARSFARQVVFVGSSLAGLGINQICMWLLVDKLALHYMLAKVVATGGRFVRNESIGRRHRNKQTQGPQLTGQGSSPAFSLRPFQRCPKWKKPGCCPAFFIYA